MPRHGWRQRHAPPPRPPAAGAARPRCRAGQVRPRHPLRLPASRSDGERPKPLSRRSRAGLGTPPHVLVERRHREAHAHARTDGRLGEHVDVAHDQRPARDDVERVRGHSERFEAAAGEPVPPLGRLVRVGGGADGDRLAAPRLPGELPPENVGDVHLDADRVAVALAGGPVGPLLERPDVTERAAVDAAHVRIERPGERHALDAVERGLARLLAIFRPHAGRIEHMFA